MRSSWLGGSRIKNFFFSLSLEVRWTCLVLSLCLYLYIYIDIEIPVVRTTYHPTRPPFLLTPHARSPFYCVPPCTASNDSIGFFPNQEGVCSPLVRIQSFKKTDDFLPPDPPQSSESCFRICYMYITARYLTARTVHHRHLQTGVLCTA